MKSVLPDSVADQPPSPDKSGAADSIVCYHCGLDVPPALIVEGDSPQFCCAGCEVAYETIHGCGLDEYYAFRDRFANDRQASKGAGKRYASFDSDAFLEQHASQTAGGLRTIDLRLEGVHCAACVWLVERLPSVAPGIIESRLSLGNSRARIVWDPGRITLSEIASRLDRFGYAPHPARDASAQASRDAAERSRLIRMAIAGALAGNNMLIAVSLYAGVFEGIAREHALLFRWLSMAIGWLSLVGPGAVFFRGAAAALRARIANLDVPIALALGVGAVAGTANVLLDRGEVYFDSLSVLVFLLLVGRYLQARQQRRAEEAVGLMLSMTPDSCRVVRGGAVVEESTHALETGDTVEVRPGELFPADGVVTLGESTVDQSLLAGESQPIPVSVGETVCAGAQNVASVLRVNVNALGESTRVGKLIRLVEEGLANKPPIVEFADRVAGWFVGAMLLVATVNFAWWSMTTGLAGAIDSTVALLIVACPCALGLATPLTMAVAIGKGSRNGMLIKNAAVLERLASVGSASPGRLFLDKTGTLTSGQLSVQGWVGDTRWGPWIAALEADSRHPAAAALRREFGPVDDSLRASIQGLSEQHGSGVTGQTPEGDLQFGSRRFVMTGGATVDRPILDAIEQAELAGCACTLLAVDGRVQAVLWLRDEMHTIPKDEIDWLRQHGWRTEILSGDADAPVQRVASVVGIDPDSVHSQKTPEEKLAMVRRATAEASHPPVMMVGDGVNDAAALAAADVGVAVHGGAEASLVAADVYLSTPGVGMLVELVRLARSTMRVARRNLLMSLTYNAIAVSLAVAGWITPLLAAVLMPISSAAVLTSACAFGLSASKPEEG